MVSQHKKSRSLAVNERWKRMRQASYWSQCIMLPSMLWHGWFADRTITTTTVLQPLYRSTCVSQHLQLRTGGFCCCKVLLPACRCWWQPMHLDWGAQQCCLHCLRTSWFCWQEWHLIHKTCATYPPLFCSRTRGGRKQTIDRLILFHP